MKGCSVAAIRFNALTVQRCNDPLRIRLRFGETDNLAAFLPLASLLKQLDSFETFQDIALCGNGACAL
jgi:hypothetical protein